VLKGEEEDSKEPDDYRDVEVVRGKQTGECDVNRVKARISRLEFDSTVSVVVNLSVDLWKSSRSCNLGSNFEKDVGT